MGLIRKQTIELSTAEDMETRMIEDIVNASRVLDKYNHIYQVRIAAELLDAYIESLDDVENE